MNPRPFTALLLLGALLVVVARHVAYAEQSPRNMIALTYCVVHYALPGKVSHRVYVEVDSGAPCVLDIPREIVRRHR